MYIILYYDLLLDHKQHALLMSQPLLTKAQLQRAVRRLTAALGTDSSSANSIAEPHKRYAKHHSVMCEAPSRQPHHCVTAKPLHGVLTKPPPIHTQIH